MRKLSLLLATACLVGATASRCEVPVTLERIDADGLRALRSNSTSKYRLVNFWATWCPPCVKEFPALVSLSRQYNNRDFELVTVSMDEPTRESKVLEFLRRQGAGMTDKVLASIQQDGRRTNHYLFAGKNSDEIPATFDPEWPGPLPYTVLIAPSGKIVWRCAGAVDLAAAREAIGHELGSTPKPPVSK
jgi:thiol-disulfide isomerase/thioredoxin